MKETIPPTEDAILIAEMNAKRAFTKWQNMRYCRAVQNRNLESTKMEMFRRLSLVATKEAAKSIKRIQAVLGIANIADPKIPGFQDKRLGLLSSREEEIARTLAEPLVSTQARSTSESPTTQN